MEPEPSWEDFERLEVSREGHSREPDEVDYFVGIAYVDDEKKDIFPINSILPDEILEQVLGHLPISIIIKAGCVCKKWNDVSHSRRFIQNLRNTSPQKPWYFMFTGDNDPHGHIYDPLLLKWFRFEIPYVESSSWNIVSSSGLMCLMDNDSRRKLYVCNPITKHCRKLEKLSNTEVSDYCALAISLEEISKNYIVTIVRSTQAPEQIDWHISIDVYSSEKKSWACPVNVTLQAWRGGADSVICGRVLYIVVYLTRTTGFIRPRYGVLAYDLTSESFEHGVDERVILAPCPITCMRLMNLDQKLVMVGGIEKQGRPGIIKGIGIWVLTGEQWEEVSRMPKQLFKGFEEFDDVFASSGCENLIYIQGYGSPALLMFEMNSKEWSWARRCPAIKKFPLQLFLEFALNPDLISLREIAFSCFLFFLFESCYWYQFLRRQYTIVHTFIFLD